jgi:hypothetical protein
MAVFLSGTGIPGLLLHGLVFVRAFIANLLEEEIVFASLTAAAIAVARCTFVGYDSGVRCRHFLYQLDCQSLAFHLFLLTVPSQLVVDA